MLTFFALKHLSVHRRGFLAISLDRVLNLICLGEVKKGKAVPVLN
jgi:hypothetical protein